MKIPRRTIVALLLTATVVLPALGPLMDHHYAERQPGHAHLRPAGEHDHGYDSLHIHTHGGVGGLTALYNDDSAPAITVVMNDDMALMLALQLEPTSHFWLPIQTQTHLRGRSNAPPKQPPRPLV